MSHHRIVCAPDSPMQAVLASLERVARSHETVLVIGETGTGKEGIVRRIHDLAPWSEGPFVALNCGAIPHNLLESELFGHVRGAFTGADRPRVGRLEAANGGTLFLDEIGELPLELQPKLLRVLQQRQFTPVGGNGSRETDCRIVAATNRDLNDAIADGTFREDLYFRLNVVELRLPALRARPNDIEPLAWHFLDLHAKPNASHVSGFAPEAMAALQLYSWPGNVRQLENLIRGILVLKEHGLIDITDVQHKLRQPARSAADTGTSAESGAPITLPASGLDIKETLAQVERDLIRAALFRTDGNKARAASLLGLNRTTLVEKLKRQPISTDSMSEAHEAVG